MTDFSQPQAPEADVLILGGGSAGCVLAARLSEDPHRRVVLVEAGRDIGPEALPPAIASAYPGTAFLNGENTRPGLAVRLAGPGPRPYEQARVLGGGSSINALLANRGAPEDYAAWEEMGAEGWGWEAVLPAFRKLETDLDFPPAPGENTGWHGGDGPIPVRRRPEAQWSGFARAGAAAAEVLGHPRVADQNAAWEDGVMAIATSQDAEGRRGTAAARYLTAAVRARPNLRILTGTQARRIVFDGTRAVGAELRGAGGDRVLRAAETVVSCGALESPALLMRSGVGPGGDLAGHGIAVVADLPGVGANLMEHPGLAVAGYLPRHARWNSLSEHHIHAGLRFTSSAGTDGPGDMHLSFVGRAAWHALGARLGVLFFWINAPRSRGVVRLASADPDRAPEVDFRLLSDPADLARMAEGMALAAALARAEPLNRLLDPVFPAEYSDIVRKLARPGRVSALRALAIGLTLDLNAGLRRKLISGFLTRGTTLDGLLADADAFAAYARRAVTGVWHPSGTCRMGRAGDPGAVLDPQGRVRGVAGLRVCDASAMPVIPRANTNLPVMMLAERMAEAVRAG